MNKQDFLADRFLIAMPTLADPNFSQTVTYICEHNPQGAMGIVINRRMEIQLGDVLQQLDFGTCDKNIAAREVYLGGPVLQERGFVVHRSIGEWETSLIVNDDIAVTTSRDILAAISTGQGPAEFLVALGYAGWGAGQLEAEMAENAWLTSPANAEIIFNTPLERRWHEAARSIGIDPGQISSYSGHA